MRRPQFEQCERRLCLSSVAFAAHDVECCAAEEADVLVVADLDRDGDTDVVFASRINNKIEWYANLDGRGEFGSRRLVDWDDGTLGGVSLTAGDLDGDGDTDLLFASALRNRIVWYENVDGAGGFGIQQVISTESFTPESLAVADLDHDGDLDVLSASSANGTIAWFENTDGGGAFGPQRIVTTDLDLPVFVTSADLDGDDDLDILSASSGDGKIAWYENTDGRGGFGPEQVITTEVEQANSIVVVDLDFDGDVDVLTGGRDIRWYENADGRGQFASHQLIASDVSSRTLALADLDGDGDMDLLSTSTDHSRLAWYENTDGLGAFGAERLINELYQTAEVAAADLDGDGNIDVVSTSIGDHKVSWFANTDGQGSFGGERLVTSNVVDVESMATADVDGDGDVDIVVTAGRVLPTGTISWYENTDGQGVFGSQRVIAEAINSPRSVAGGDLDGDGDMDILSAELSQIAWYENTDGQGSFGESRRISAETVGNLTAVDLDGDGDADVLAGGSKPVWYENTDGRGTFGPAREVSDTVVGVRSMTTADVDGDGDLDIVLASSSDDAIVWYENRDGHGSFAPQRIIAADISFTGSVVATDLDGDDDLDVLVALVLADKVVWYQNTDGRGSFGTEQIITTESDGPLSLAVADFDEDGDTDVVSASSGDGKVAWYENLNGGGAFGAPSVIDFEPAARGTYVVATADLNQDADADVVFAAFHRISWYDVRLSGDVNDDGRFNSTDLVQVFQAGEYEDRIVRNSTFDEGDWNRDGEFNSSDLVLAFQGGHYEASAEAMPSEVAALVDWLFGRNGHGDHWRVYVP